MFKTRLITAITLLILLMPSIAITKRPINDVYAVLFVMDGLNKQKFNEVLALGKIPTIKKYFIDQGASFSKALTIFPSASSPAYPAFISGLFPGHSGVVYLGWFDRTKKKPVDYFSPMGRRRMDTDFLNLRALLDPNEPDLYPPSTIFDYLSDYETTAIYSSFNGTAKHTHPSIPLAAGWAVFGSGREEMLDRYAFDEINELFDRPTQDIPRFSLVGLYSFDSFGHHFGPQSEMLDYNLERFDQLLAKFIEKLKTRGLFDKTYIILAADHGMHPTPRGKFDLKKRLVKLGLTPYPGHPRKAEFNVHLSSRGVTTAHLYFKGSGLWTTRPAYKELRNYPTHNGEHIDVIQKLRESPEVKLTVVRDGFNRVQILSKECQATISIKDDKYRYDIAKGGCDPLKINESEAKPLISRGYFDDRQWGKRTADHFYPDAVVQLSQIFADGRAGDIFIIPENDWVFFRDKLASHGSIVKGAMQIPFMLRGPTVPIGQFDFMRVTDLYPTMLDWFGIQGNPDHFDGRHLFKKSKKNHQRTTKEKSRKKLEIIYSRLSQGDDESPVKNANLWIIQQQLERLNQ